MNLDPTVQEIVPGLTVSDEQRKNLTSYLRRDNTWQQRARLLQTLWGLGRPDVELDAKYAWWIARCPDPARLEAGGFLTDEICAEANRALSSEAKEASRLISKDRLGRCLLSSQPLCFNAFGELSGPGSEAKATDVLKRLWPDLVGSITKIRYEHNPRRGPFGPTGTYTAFDVFIDVVTPQDQLGFIGIEVKYHEDMTEKPPTDGNPSKMGYQQRLTALNDAARRIGKTDRTEILSEPGWQVWLDHALALAMLDPDVQTRQDCFPAYQRGAFVMLSPRSNEAVTSTFHEYKRAAALPDDTADTLRFCTLDDFITACTDALPDESWPSELFTRYLDESALAEW